METSKQGFVEATAPHSLVSAQREDAMHAVQTSLPTVYFHALGGLPLYGQPKPSGGQDALAFPLPLAQPSSKQALSLLTLHVAGEVSLQQPGQKPGVVAAGAAVRPKSAGKHMCSYCGRDCLKPSVLEKHLRCHTGERPYPCTTCGVAFKTQSNLYKHKRTQAHARISSDSSERDSLASQESVQGSEDVSWSMSSLDGQFEGSGSLEKDAGVPVPSSSSTTSMVQVSPAQTGHDTGWVPQKAPAVELILTPGNGNQEPQNSASQNTVHCVPNAKHEQGGHPAPSVPARHLFLQRQEAMIISKQWESRVSGGKSQNHDSTDSGFSESSEQHWSLSPSGTLHDHSMESLAESSTEEQEELRAPQRHTDSGATTSKGAKNRVSLLEKRKLEERICKLISENDALVDDKYLENVRPRKTMPSKQGSIDLPMPYTYKDSFHFEMKTSRHSFPNIDWQNSEKQVRQALYSSVPTQRSLSLEHAPLVRSSSLPFNVGRSGFERASIHGSYQAESTQQSGRDRTAHAYPGDLLMRSMDQPTSHHRSLVRQKAVDGLPAADLPNLPSTEEHFPSALSGEGNSAEPTGESSGGKCRRKKLPKFSYNKWYMYGDGTFRKLCNMEKASERNTFRVKKSANSMEQEKGQEIQNTTQSSGIPTPDASNMDSACNPCQVPPHLPPSGCANLEQAPSNPDASNAFTQKRFLRNLTVSTQQIITKQSNIQTINNKNDGRLKELDLEEDNSESPSSSSKVENDLPSERKKQRTDDSVCVPVEKTNAVTTSPCVECQEEKDAVLRQNHWLPFIGDYTTQKYTSIPEQKNTATLKEKIMDFQTSSTDHQLNQKTIRLQEYDSSPSQENVRRLPVPTTSSFLPKYQLKLPQSTDLMTSAPCLTGSLPSTPNRQVTEKHFPPNTLMTGKGQIFAPILASAETPTEKTAAASVNRQSPPTPTSSTFSLRANHHATAVTSNSAPSNACFLSPSSQITQYKGKLTLLNSAKPDAAEDRGHDREPAGDIHIFLEIVSGEQLSVMEAQQETKQEVVYSKDILQEQMKSAKTSAGIQMLCATQKPQEIMSSEAQARLSAAEKTIKEIAPSGEASSMSLLCTTSDWGSIFHTKQDAYLDESSQRSSVHPNPSVTPVESGTSHSAQRDNAERSQNKERSGSNLDEPGTANQVASIQKQGGYDGCRDTQSLKPHICPFQEGMGQMSSVGLETHAAEKPSEGVTETAETAEQLPAYRQDVPSLPTPGSAPADWKIGPHSPCNHRSSSATAQQQAHVIAPLKLVTCDEATGSSGGSSPGPVPVQHQHRFIDMSSVLQNTLHAAITPLQLTNSKKLSPSQCQEQNVFTCEPRHPFPSPHATLGIILPSDQTTWSQSPNAALTSQGGLDMAMKKGSTDKQQTLKIPTDSPISSSDDQTLVPVTNKADHCNSRPLNYEEKKIFLLDKLPSKEHKTNTKKGPNSADPKDANSASDATKLGEKPQLGKQHHIFLSPNEGLKVSQQEVAERGSSVPAPLNVSAAQRDKNDKDIQSAFSHCRLAGMFPKASSKTPTVSQQIMDLGTPHFQQKLAPTAKTHSSPSTTTGTGSRGLLVHVVGQNDMFTRGFPFHVGHLNGASEKGVIALSQTQAGRLAGRRSVDAGSHSSGQHREASPVSLSLTGTDKNKLHHKSVTWAGTTTASLLSDKAQPTTVTLVTSDSHCQTNPGPSDSLLTYTIGTSLCTKSVMTVTSSLSQDRSASQSVGLDESVAGRHASTKSYALETQPACKGVSGHVDVCIISRDPAAAGLAPGGDLISVDLWVKHKAQDLGEPGERRRQLEGGEEGETTRGGRRGQDGRDPGASATPGPNRGGFTEVGEVRRDTGANESSWCGSLSLQPGVTALQTPTLDTGILKGQLQPGVTTLQTPSPDIVVLKNQHQPGVTGHQTSTSDNTVLKGQLQPRVTALQTPTPDITVLKDQLQSGVTALQTPTPDTTVLKGRLQPRVTALQTPTPDTLVLKSQLQPRVTALQTPTSDTVVLKSQLHPGVTSLQTPTLDTAILTDQLQPGVTTLQTPTPDTAVLKSQLQLGVTALQTPTPDTAVTKSQLQPGVTTLQTPTPDTAVLKSQLQPGVTALQTPTLDTAILTDQLQPGVTSLQTPTPDTAVLKSQLQPGVTALQTPTPDTAVLKTQLQPGVTALQTPTPDTAVLKGQLQPSMQSKAKEVNSLQSPGEMEACRLRKCQSGTALSHTSQSCPRVNFPVPVKGETGGQLTSRHDSSRLSLFPALVKSGTMKSADQTEVQDHRNLKQVLQTPLDPPTEVPCLTSSSSMGNPLLARAAQRLGEWDSQAGCGGGRTSASHSLKERSLQSPEEHPRTSAQDKPGDLSQLCRQGTGRTPARPELTGSASSQPGPRRSPLIRSQTSPAFCLMPPCGRAKGLGGSEEPSGKVAASAREEGADSSSSDDEGKLVIELE